MIRTQVYFPESQMRSLKKKAAEENVSVSEAIRRAVDAQFATKQEKKEKKYKNSGEWLLSLAKEAKRFNFKGPKDLATNMDDYLYGGKK